MHSRLPTLLMALAPLAAACAAAPRGAGAPEDPAGSPSAQVRVSDAMSAEDFTYTVVDFASQAGARGECALALWLGPLGAGPLGSPRGIPLRVEGSRLAFEGAVLCGAELEAQTRDARQLVVLIEQDGVLYGAHPSGPGRTPMTGAAGSPEWVNPEWEHLLALVHERVLLSAAPVAPTLRRLAALRRGLIVLWGLPPPGSRAAR